MDLPNQKQAPKHIIHAWLIYLYYAINLQSIGHFGTCSSFIIVTLYHVHVCNINCYFYIEIPSASTSDNDSDNNMDVDEVHACHIYKLLIATLQYRMQCSAARVMMK